MLTMTVFGYVILLEISQTTHTPYADNLLEICKIDQNARNALVLL